MRVAVAPTKFAPGVAAPGERWPKWTPEMGEPSYDWRSSPGSPQNTRGVVPAHHVVELALALERRYPTDAHLVTYYLVGPDGLPLASQPRLKKTGLSWVLDQGFTVEHDLLMVDVDNPGHCEWNDDLRARFDELLERCPPLQSAGVYLTRAGYRILQELDEPVPAGDGEGQAECYLASWIDELADHGIFADGSCVDWTRLFRLPHVRRGPVAFVSPLVDLGNLRPKRIHPKAHAGARSRRAELGSRAA